MSLRIAIPGTLLRHRPDAVVADRLRHDIVRGIRSAGRTSLVGGCRVPLGAEYVEYAEQLERQPCATVVRHDDGSIDVTLSESVRVWLAPEVAR